MKKISKKTKTILLSTLLTIPPILIATSVSGYIIKKEKDTISEYKNVISSEINNFESKVNDKFIKGADISSYADVIENLLFQNNIKDKNGNWYTYKDFENPDIKVWDNFQNRDVTLEEYANSNLYSYFDDEGNRVYDNLFSILRKKGINSLRLKLWVNPYDENGNSYGGGHNDLDTNIFILKQAKKYGFNDFLLDFQYSDFWADPDKQFIPN
ncbi:MAG: glycosyl hydrolase 53 family protein, partial [Ureaplasma sp.]|nr:glycosyl hydrolase 53 family protein [Ureaplasma sp.]